MSLQEGEQSGETENNMNFGLLSRQVKNTESAYTSGKKKNKQEKMEERTFLLKKRSKSKSRQHKNVRVTQQRQLFK